MELPSRTILLVWSIGFYVGWVIVNRTIAKAKGLDDGGVVALSVLLSPLLGWLYVVAAPSRLNPSESPNSWAGAHPERSLYPGPAGTSETTFDAAQAVRLDLEKLTKGPAPKP